jgi:hypothetical protein
MGLPKTGFTSEVYSLHLLYDGVQGPAAGTGIEQGDVLGVAGFEENLLGGRSGLLSAANGGATYSQPVVRPRQSVYEDTNSGGTVTYVVGPPGTMTDTARAWPVNKWAGARLTAPGTGLADSFITVASNTATVITGTATAWSNGVPAAGALYRLAPPPVGPHVYPGGNPRPAAENSDNFYKANRELGDTEAV